MTTNPGDGGQPAATAVIDDAPASAEELAGPRTTGQRIHDLLHSRPNLGPAAVLILAIVVFSIVSDNFLATNNVSLVLQQVTVVATLAVGQTIIILTAGIDLSVGAIAVLSSIVMAKLSAEHGLAGTARTHRGLRRRHGLRTHQRLARHAVELPPFIVTLGTLNIFFALNLWYSEAQTIRGTDMSSLLLWTGETFGSAASGSPTAPFSCCCCSS